MTSALRRILVIEDEAAIRNVVRVLLETEHYEVTEAETAAGGEAGARALNPDLLLVDLGLPDGDGLVVIRNVRAWSPAPIIVLSARTMEVQKIAALDAGADDFVTKPFSSPELLARVRAALRRSRADATESAPLRFGDKTVRLGRREASGPDGDFHLTALEFRLLDFFAQHAGLVVTPNQLLSEVWGVDRLGDTRVLRVAVANLRSKLEPDPRRPRYLITETGLGYRLQTDEDFDCVVDG
jgi:two-component system KDP operon response regulator KdpE